MTIFEFNEQLCEIIAGEDGYYNYDKQEILELAKQMKTSAEEYQNELECKDAAEVHELMNPAVCDIWSLQTGDTTATSSPSTRNMYESFKLQRKELNN